MIIKVLRLTKNIKKLGVYKREYSTGQGGLIKAMRLNNDRLKSVFLNEKNTQF